MRRSEFSLRPGRTQPSSFELRHYVVIRHLAHVHISPR